MIHVFILSDENCSLYRISHHDSIYFSYSYRRKEMPVITEGVLSEPSFSVED